MILLIYFIHNESPDIHTYVYDQTNTMDHQIFKILPEHNADGHQCSEMKKHFK